MNLLDIFIENYDFTGPQNLSDDDISLLWTEITSGIEVFKVGENLDIKAENYAKVLLSSQRVKSGNYLMIQKLKNLRNFYFLWKNWKKKEGFNANFARCPMPINIC